MDYLACLFNKGVGYSTINTARSALSTVSSILGGTKIGESSTICRFMKGVFNLRPSLPRHINSWDPDVVLRYLDVDSKNLKILEFSRKVAFLVTFLSGQRVATIAQLRLKDLQITENQLLIKVGLIKQSRPGYNQQPIIFNKFGSKPNICVFTQLSEYIKQTANYRSDDCACIFLTTLNLSSQLPKIPSPIG